MNEKLDDKPPSQEKTFLQSWIRNIFRPNNSVSLSTRGKTMVALWYPVLDRQGIRGISDYVLLASTR